jgi:predicted acyltransferase
LSGGVSLVALSALLLLPGRGLALAVSYPLRVLGANAILAFILSQLLGVFSELPIVPSRGGAITPQQWGFRTASNLIPDPYLASLACALGILVVIVLAIAPLHRRSLFLRV